MEDQIKFSYPLYYKIGSYILSFLIIFPSILYMVGTLIETLQLIIFGDGQHNQIVFLNILILISYPIVVTSIINYWQEFTITAEGIEFQVFIFWKKFVRWEDIIEIKKSYLPWGKYHIIITQQLTPFYRIIGLLYGLTFSPAFIFNTGLKNYQDAVETIKQKLV